MAPRLPPAIRSPCTPRTRLPNNRPSSFSFSSTSYTGRPAAPPPQPPEQLTSAFKAFDYLGKAMRAVPTTEKVMDESTRRFMPNEFLYPHQLTRQSMNTSLKSQNTPRPPLLGPGKRQALLSDPFVASGSSPLDHWHNPLFVQDFLNQVGMIRPRRETGLTRKTQKQVGRMVKRARQMGIVAVWTNRPAEGGVGYGSGTQFFRD